MIQSTTNATNTGASRMRLTTAPLLKFCWPITCLKMSSASTLKLPPMTLGMPKSLTVYENTTIAALTRPYLAPGSVIVKNLRHVGVRSDSAASYRRPSESSNAVKTIISACGNVA